MSIVVGWLDGGNTTGDFTESVAKLTSYEASQGRLGDIIRIRSGPQMPEGRNFLVQDFLDTDGEWLFMVDSDMVFPHDSAKRLLDSADPQTAPVVGGLCFGLDKTLGQFPTLYRDIGGHPAVLFDFPASGLVEVDGTGAAFILTHRSVFENNIRPGVHKWYHRFEIPGGATGFGVAPGGMLGEDLSWCRWLRSRGVPIYVNVGVEAGHVKPITIGRSTYARKS